MTIEQFEELSDPPGGHYELHHGELVTRTVPKLKHALIQRQLRKLLEELAEAESFVDTEVGFRPIPEHEYWRADVAWLSAESFRQADPEGNIQGAPDLVIEVLSPSNTASEMLDKEQTCLANGSREFWLVDPVRRRIKVTTSNGQTTTYESGQQIPLPFGMNNRLRVDDVFHY